MRETMSTGMWRWNVECALHARGSAMSIPEIEIGIDMIQFFPAFEMTLCN